MIQSKFIHSILTLLVDTDEHEQLLKAQIELVQESEFEYTGAGVFISFIGQPEINSFRIPTDTKIINGVKIESTELNIGADASLFITNGVIDYLEIWSFDAEYPRSELQDYRLSQIWIGAPGREIISKRP